MSGGEDGPIERFLIGKRMKTSSRRRFWLWWNWNGLSTHWWTNDQERKTHTAWMHEYMCYSMVWILLYASDCARSQRQYFHSFSHTHCPKSETNHYTETPQSGFLVRNPHTMQCYTLHTKAYTQTHKHFKYTQFGAIYCVPSNNKFL